MLKVLLRLVGNSFIKPLTMESCPCFTISLVKSLTRVIVANANAFKREEITCAFAQIVL